MPATADNKLYSEILAKARKQLFWDQKKNPPAINSPRFILRVMELGTWEMVEALEANFSKSRLVETLQAAPCGSLSPRSWNFWCLRLGVDIHYPSRFTDY